MNTPTFCVGPVRSHCWPNSTSLPCFSWALAEYAPKAIVPARIAAVVQALFTCVIASSHVASPCLIGERPDSEIIPYVAPEPVQSFRLEHQEHDNQCPEDNEPHARDHRGHLTGIEEDPADALHHGADNEWQQSNECRAQDRSEHRAQSADDDHREIIDGDIDLELLVVRDPEVIGVKHAADTGVERRDREGDQFVTIDVDADDLGSDILHA